MLLFPVQKVYPVLNLLPMFPPVAFFQLKLIQIRTRRIASLLLQGNVFFIILFIIRSGINAGTTRDNAAHAPQVCPAWEAFKHQYRE